MHRMYCECCSVENSFATHWAVVPKVRQPVALIIEQVMVSEPRDSQLFVWVFVCTLEIRSVMHRESYHVKPNKALKVLFRV